MFIRDEDDIAVLQASYQEAYMGLIDPVQDAIDEAIKGLEGKTDASSVEYLNLLNTMKPQLIKLKELEVDTMNPEVRELMQSTGGRVLRYVNEDVFKSSFASLDTDSIEYVAEQLLANYPEITDLKAAKSLAEYFLGRKNVPDYEKMTKAAKILSKAGITDKTEFNKMKEDADDWFEEQIGTEFGEFEAGGENFVGEYKEKVKGKIKSLEGPKNKKKMAKALEKAIKAHLGDISAAGARENILAQAEEGGETEPDET